MVRNVDFFLIANKSIDFQLTFMAYYLWIHQWEVQMQNPNAASVPGRGTRQMNPSLSSRYDPSE